MRLGGGQGRQGRHAEGGQEAALVGEAVQHAVVDELQVVFVVLHEEGVLLGEVAHLQTDLGADTIRVRFGYDSDTIRIRFGYDSGTIRMRFGCDSDTIRIRFGCDSDTIRIRFG